MPDQSLPRTRSGVRHDGVGYLVARLIRKPQRILDFVGGISVVLQETTGKALIFAVQIRFDSNETVVYIGISDKGKWYRKLQVSGQKTVVVIPSILNLST